MPVWPSLLPPAMQADDEFSPQLFYLLALNWPSPPKPARSNTVPVEMWLDIFEFVCEGGEGETFFEYNDLRDGLCNAFGEWAVAVERTPAFWRKLSIDCISNSTTVYRHLRCAGDGWFDVNIVFDINITFSSDSLNSMPVHPSDIQYRVGIALRCLLVAAPSVSRWRHACLWSTTDVFMRPILDVFGPLAGPNIESLLFAGSAYSAYGAHTAYSIAHKRDHLFVDPPIIFGGGMPRLQELRLMAIPVLGMPNYAQLHSALFACVSLEHLTISGAVVQAPSPSSAFQAFELPRLQTLSLRCSSGFHDIFDFFTHATFPALTELSIDYFDMNAWRAVILHPSMFATIETLSISGGTSTSDLPYIFRRLVRWRILNLALAGLSYFYELAAVPRACPRLISISVGRVALNVVHKCICGRRLATSLSTIHYDHDLQIPLTQRDAQMVQEIQSRTPSFLH
ncbi:hypothetical protein DFH09DRAFT_1096895 [Mycena vulgaris]|nr:hypothetical protein DFH09DRAFT_1096895 [Mycena vulgaris]